MYGEVGFIATRIFVIFKGDIHYIFMYITSIFLFRLSFTAEILGRPPMFSVLQNARSASGGTTHSGKCVGPVPVQDRR